MPLDTRDRDPFRARMFWSNEELSRRKAAAEQKVRADYDARTRALAAGAPPRAGEADAPVDKFKQGPEAELAKAKANAGAGGAPRDEAQGLLDLIAQAEVKGHPVSYDTTYGFGRYDPPGYDNPVSQMTLDELDRFQRDLRRRGRNSPVGKYQIAPLQMTELRRRLRLTGREIYDPALQERLGRETLRMAGYDDYMAGRIGAGQLQDGIARYWASVPTQAGKSRYPQPIGVSPEELRREIERLNRLSPGRQPPAR